MSTILLARRRGGASAPITPIYTDNFNARPDGALQSAWTSGFTPSPIPDGQFYWLSDHGGTVNTVSPIAGAKSLNFIYPADAVATERIREQRMILPQLCTGGFGVEADVRISSNFFLRNGGSGSTHKFFQFWQSTYTTSFTVGASFRRDTISGTDRAEFMPIISSPAVGNVGGLGAAETFPTASGRTFIRPASVSGAPIGILIPGQTHNVKFWVRYSTASGANDGRYEFWVDGVLFCYADVDIYSLSGTPGIQYGYLMGSSNAGYAEETTWTWDNVKFYSGATRWF